MEKDRPRDKKANGKRPKQNLLIVETINSPSADKEKGSTSVSTLKKLAKSRKHVKIVGSSKILDEEDFRNDSVHLNERGITKLVEEINSFMKENNMKEIIRDEHGFLSQRPYQGVTREYTFGCKMCSEQQCPPNNSSQPQESSNSNKRRAEFLTALKGLDAKKSRK